MVCSNGKESYTYQNKNINCELFNKGKKCFHVAIVISSLFKLGGISAIICAAVSFVHVGSVSPLILLLIPVLMFFGFLCEHYGARALVKYGVKSVDVKVETGSSHYSPPSYFTN